MGFIYVKSTKYAQRFWEAFSNLLLKSIHPNDQRAFNFLVMQRRITFDTASGVADFNSNLTDHGHFLVQGQRLNISYLPQRQVRRNCSDLDDGRGHQLLRHVIVLHCATSKNDPKMRIEILRRFGAWSLRSDWELRKTEAVSDVKSFMKIMHDSYSSRSNTTK